MPLKIQAGYYYSEALPNLHFVPSSLESIEYIQYILRHIPAHPELMTFLKDELKKGVITVNLVSFGTNSGALGETGADRDITIVEHKLNIHLLYAFIFELHNVLNYPRFSKIFNSICRGAYAADAETVFAKAIYSVEYETGTATKLFIRSGFEKYSWDLLQDKDESLNLVQHSLEDAMRFSHTHHYMEGKLLQVRIITNYKMSFVEHILRRVKVLIRCFENNWSGISVRNAIGTIWRLSTPDNLEHEKLNGYFYHFSSNLQRDSELRQLLPEQGSAVVDRKKVLEYLEEKRKMLEEKFERLKQVAIQESAAYSNVGIKIPEPVEKKLKEENIELFKSLESNNAQLGIKTAYYCGRNFPNIHFGLPMSLDTLDFIIQHLEKNSELDFIKKIKEFQRIVRINLPIINLRNKPFLALAYRQVKMCYDIVIERTLSGHEALSFLLDFFLNLIKNDLKNACMTEVSSTPTDPHSYPEITYTEKLLVLECSLSRDVAMILREIPSPKQSQYDRASEMTYQEYFVNAHRPVQVLNGFSQSSLHQYQVCSFKLQRVKDKIKQFTFVIQSLKTSLNQGQGNDLLDLLQANERELKANEELASVLDTKIAVFEREAKMFLEMLQTEKATPLQFSRSFRVSGGEERTKQRARNLVLRRDMPDLY